MDIKIFSLFPEMFSGPLGSSLLGKARSKDILNIEVINFREYSTNKHHAVFFCKRLCDKLGIGLAACSEGNGTTVTLSFYINDFVTGVQG